MKTGRARRLRLGILAIGLLVAPGAEPAIAAATDFRARFVCNDRGGVYPLAGARVELRERGLNGEEILPRVLDPTLAIGHADPNGRVGLTFNGPDENWRGKSRNFYLRIVLADNDGVRAEEWYAPWAWFADSATNQNDVPVQDYGTLALGDGRISPECAAFEGGRRAYHGYRAEVGERPPYGDLKINLNSPSSGVPFAPHDRIQWPPRYPPGDSPGGFESVNHEFGHTFRHAFDGSLAHFLVDAGRFNYLQRHNVCKRTNAGFAFNEGWASYWARTWAPAPNCAGLPANDYAVEGNVAAALAALDANCAGVGRVQMVRVLRRNPGRIHSYDEFLQAFQTDPGCVFLPSSAFLGQALPGVGAVLGRGSRIAAVKRQLIPLRRAQVQLGRRLRAADVVADRRNPCRPRPCVPALIKEIRPSLLAMQRRHTVLLRKTLAPLATKRTQKRLGGLAPRPFLRFVDSRSRSFAKGYAAIGRKGLVGALKAARPYLRRGGAPARAIVGGVRAALRSVRRGRSSTIFGLPAPGAVRLRSVGPLPAPEPGPTPAQERKVVFVSGRDGNAEIYVMNADGSGQTRLTTNAGVDTRPAWSPDGRRIAFASDRAGEGSEIYVMNADGSGQTPLTSGPQPKWAPDWSPDGQRIAFVGDSGEGRQLFVMNADGTNPTPLPALAPQFAPDWSPDGQRIAFAMFAGENIDVFTIAPDGSDTKRITQTGDLLEQEPTWSPDGTKFALTTSTGLAGEISVMNADGSGAVPLTDNEASNGSPAWSADGRRIVFHSERDGNLEIYVMNADGSGQTRLTNSPGEDQMPDWAWQP